MPRSRSRVNSKRRNRTNGRVRRVKTTAEKLVQAMRNINRSIPRGSTYAATDPMVVPPRTVRPMRPLAPFPDRRTPGSKRLSPLDRSRRRGY